MKNNFKSWKKSLTRLRPSGPRPPLVSELGLHLSQRCSFSVSTLVFKLKLKLKRRGKSLNLTKSNNATCTYSVKGAAFIDL